MIRSACGCVSTDWVVIAGSFTESVRALPRQVKGRACLTKDLLLSMKGCHQLDLFVRKDTRYAVTFPRTKKFSWGNAIRNTLPGKVSQWSSPSVILKWYSYFLSAGIASRARRETRATCMNSPVHHHRR